MYLKDERSHPRLTKMVNLKTSDVNNELCICCKENFCNFITRCKHFFHQACLVKIINRCKKCPICSTFITSNSLWEKFLADYEIEKEDIYQESFDNLVDFVHLIAESKVKIDEKSYKIAFSRSLKLDQNLTEFGRDGISLLYKAAKNGHLFIVKLCLRNFSKSLNDEQHYPLFAACEENNPDIVNLLLENGALIDKKDPDTDCRFAHYVAMSGNLDIINRAIEMKVDFLVNNRENLSPLHFACQNGHLEAAKKLIELGADINALSTDGYSMLHASCSGGNFDLFKMLLDMGLDIHSTYRNGVSSIHAAAYGGNFDILNYLIDQKVDSSKALFNPLHVAANLNNLEMTKKLLDLNFDINSADSDGDTPLHISCAFEFNELANYLLDHGAKIDILNAKGESAVQQAYEIRNSGIIYHERLLNQTLAWTAYSYEQEIEMAKLKSPGHI